MFTSFEAYEQFIYELPDKYPSIQTSTLTLIRRGRYIAIVKGDVYFQQGIRLHIYEELTTIPTMEVTNYGYEVWRHTEKLYWYDSQPHPTEPTLAATHPHHKHVPPDIKHNRIIAPGLSFTRSNLPFLIEEIEHDLLKTTP